MPTAVTCRLRTTGVSVRFSELSSLSRFSLLPCLGRRSYGSETSRERTASASDGGPLDSLLPLLRRLHKLRAHLNCCYDQQKSAPNFSIPRKNRREECSTPPPPAVPT